MNIFFNVFEKNEEDVSYNFCNVWKLTTKAKALYAI